MAGACRSRAILAAALVPPFLFGLAGCSEGLTAKPADRVTPDAPLQTVAAPEWTDPVDVAFVSKADGSEQKYVELLPKGFDDRQVHHLVIALHGLYSDRWQYIRDGRGECAGSREVALRHGMIFVSPDYRATGSWMNAAAEADLVQIIAEQRKKHRIGKVILTGASMGGTSVLIFAALHPDLVDGVVSENGTANMMEYKNFPDTVEKAYGGPQAEKPEEYRKRSPELTPEKFTMPIAFTAGGKDTSVPPQSVLRLSEAVKRTNPSVLVRYREEVGHETDLKDTVEAMEFVVGAVLGKKACPASRSLVGEGGCSYVVLKVAVRSTPQTDEPFMEHPGGEFGSSLAAITSAMERLCAMGPTDKWITFSGQGQGRRADSYHVEDVPFRGTTFDLRGQTVDLDSVMRIAGLDVAKVGADRDPEGKISLPDATPRELAKLLDAIFRVHFGIRPFDGETDYAVGAEW